VLPRTPSSVDHATHASAEADEHLVKSCSSTLTLLPDRILQSSSCSDSTKLLHCALINTVDTATLQFSALRPWRFNTAQRRLDYSAELKESQQQRQRMRTVQATAQQAAAARALARTEVSEGIAAFEQRLASQQHSLFTL
jgi:hypothetical protein